MASRDLGMRRARRYLYRRVNAAFSHFGVTLVPLHDDFDVFPSDEFTREAIFTALAASFDDWNSSQELFTPYRFDTPSVVRGFFYAWMETPFRAQTGGSRFNNLLWLHLLSASMRPSVIIDSGTYQGASAWALATGAASSEVYSYDVDLTNLKYRSPGVNYIERDWFSDPPATSSAESTLAYFDDHVDQARRLIEATAHGCSLVIFDDDFPITSYYQMAPTAGVLPKIEFLLDETLHDGQCLIWSDGTRELRWTFDEKYASKARACIKATTRLPFTGLITGIHQTPYRVVVPRV